MIPVDGIFVIDKPAGVTSHDVVARVRKIIGERRVGHTGTLDPFATGVLVMLVGRATRLAQFLSRAEKKYQAVIRLGYGTDTGDVTGKRLDDAEKNVTMETRKARRIHREDIESALASLRGEIEQTPPMYSAKKIAGRKLYEFARRGEEVERRAVRVTVHSFEAVVHDGAVLKQNDDGTLDLTVLVVCSAGTYVRSLAEALGELLGVGAHLASLRRTRAGRLKIENAVTLDQLNELAQSGSIAQALIPPNAALSDLPLVQLSADEVRGTLHGIDMQIDGEVTKQLSGSQPVRMSDANGQLIAVGVYDHSRRILHPSVVILNE